MRKFLIIFVSALGFAGLFSLTSCLGMMAKSGQAEVVVDSFYTHVQHRDYDALYEGYAVKDVNTSKEDWLEVFYMLEDMGELKSWEKGIGFNVSINNGVTTAELDYSCEYESGTTSDHFVLVDRGAGFKVAGYHFEVLTIPEPRLDL